MNYFSFHTHSDFCDGKTSMEEVCKRAIELGLSAVGFSSHAPVPFKTKWAMQFDDVIAYASEVKRCKALFADEIKIYAALEADYIPVGNSVSYDAWRQMADLDYIIGSVHLVANPSVPDELWFLDGPAENYEKGINACFGGDVKKAVGQFYKQIQDMVKFQKPDVIAHMDKVVMNNKGRFYKGDEDWYLDLVEETLRVVAQYGTIVEVNTRGIYRGKYHTFFPNEQIIKRCVDIGIPLTVSVDAHHPDELTAEFETAVLVVEKLGGKDLAYFNDGKWEQLPISDVLK
ncbi:histidinol-phosphatase [Carboxylicivirga sp. N1Y90]|uniref:histidinol-phosphatase n=1 Tax=Carboxylicivirga fragile TaxID=3417571 RepID=UPI003D330F28|nr:histidinol-phosphatase [Marinilabiliaceae bacterium N1Y90]